MSVVLGYDESPGRGTRCASRSRWPPRSASRSCWSTARRLPGPTGEEYRAHHEAVRQAGRDRDSNTPWWPPTRPGCATTVEVIDQKPAQALIDAASRHEARLIVVGSWGESPIRGALLGSTPHKLLHLSDVPVLCVPTKGLRRHGQRPSGRA